MENQKDNPQINTGHGEHKNTLIFGSSGYMGSFSGHTWVNFIKRTERIVTALYLVTDGIEEKEPLKLTLRTRCVSLIEHAYAIMEYSGAQLFLQESVFVEKFLILRSLISLAHSSGLISGMNGAILEREMSSVIDQVEAKRTKESGPTFGERAHETHRDITLTEDYFKYEHTIINPQLPAHHTHSDTKNSDHEHIETPHSTKGHQIPSLSYKGHVSGLRDLLSQHHTEKKLAPESTLPKSDIALRLARRNNILKLIKDKREVTIKDISSVVSEIGEKTIQRELLALTAEGVLKKTGEKRWSRYSLNLSK